jgi:hypothetical protein
MWTLFTGRAMKLGGSSCDPPLSALILIGLLLFVPSSGAAAPVRCEDTWISGCSGWATDFQQHAYVVVMYGTPDMDPGQLATIKDACFAAAVASQISGVTFTADTIAQILGSHRPIMESMLKTCIKTTETLGRIVVDDFRLELERKDFW